MMNHHVTALYKRRANRIEYRTMGHVTGGYAAANAAVTSTLWHAVPCCMRQVVNVNLWAGSAVRLAFCTLKLLIWTWTKCNTFKLKLQSLLMPWRLEFSALGRVTVHDLQNPHSLLFFILYSFQSVIHVTPATSQSKCSSICSLHTLTNLYSAPYLIQLLQVRSIYIYSNTPCTIGLAKKQ